MIESKSGVLVIAIVCESDFTFATRTWKGSLPGPERARIEAASMLETISRRIAGPSNGGSTFSDFCAGLYLCSSKPCFSLKVPVGPEARPK